MSVPHKNLVRPAVGRWSNAAQNSVLVAEFSVTPQTDCLHSMMRSCIVRLMHERLTSRSQSRCSRGRAAWGRPRAQFTWAFWRRPPGRRWSLFDLDPQRSLTVWWRSRAAETPVLVELDARRLRDMLKVASTEGYDLAVVDTPPAVTFDTAQVAAAVDLVSIPLRPSILDIYAVESTAEVVKAAKASATAGPERMSSAARDR